MSTKTTFKRIALATVATLGFGILSVVPSHAANMQADTLLNAADGSAAVASTVAVNAEATAKIVYSSVATNGAGDSATITGSITSIPATAGAFQVSFVPTLGDSPDSESGTTTAVLLLSGTYGNTITAGKSGRGTKYITAKFTPDVAGTYTIALKASGGVNNPTVIWTVTASPVAPATAAASTLAWRSYSLQGNNNAPNNIPNVHGVWDYWYDAGHWNAQYGNNHGPADALATLVTEDTDKAPVEAVTPAIAGRTLVSGVIELSNAVGIKPNTAVKVPLTASISGHGYISLDGQTFGTTITEPSTYGYNPFDLNYGRVAFFDVKTDGTPGPATVTISAAGTVIGTLDIIFTGPKTSLALGTKTATKLSKSYIGSGDTATVTINALDASGNILGSTGIVSVKSSDDTGAIASVSAQTDNTVEITGGPVSGKVTWTVTDDKKNTITFVTNTVKKTGTFVLSFDAASYGPGEKVTWTVTGTDSNGSPVSDGKHAAFGSVDANMAVATLGVGSLPETSPVFTSGIATGSFYAPATASGTFNMTTTIGAADSTYATASAAALAAKTVSSFTISNAPVDAATDAANQAYDAANAATDAALAAADAADAATSAAQDASDAVAALSATVAKLVASLKAQITSLTNLVIKIQKKVKA